MKEKEISKEQKVNNIFLCDNCKTKIYTPYLKFSKERLCSECIVAKNNKEKK